MLGRRMLVDPYSRKWVVALCTCAVGALVTGAPALALDQSVVAPKAMISAGHPLAVASGLNALRNGGTACDAAVAAAATLSVPMVDMMGPLGSGFALVYTPGAEDSSVRAIDFNGVAPLATDPALYESMQHKRRGILAPTVPGNLKGWEAIHRECGRLPWADLWQDAIRYAEEGWNLDSATVFHINRHIPELGISQGWVDEFLNDGQPVEIGDLQVRPELAETYKQFAELGSDALYNGPVGEKLIAFMEKEGGLITQEDLEAYEVIWSEPITTQYRGHTIYGNQPPSSSMVWMEILNILDGYDLASMEHNSADYLRLLIEATKHAYEDSYRYGGDRAFSEVPTDRLLSPEYGAEVRGKIDAEPVRAFKPVDTASLHRGESSTHSTSHMVIIDEEGNAISMTNTHGTFFGMGMVVEGTGLLMSNGMDWFDIDRNIWNDDSPNVLAMEPGKRNRWTLSPGMIFQGEDLTMLVGGAGAEATMWGIAQPIINTIDFGMDAQEALNTARARYGDIAHYTGGTNVGLEEGISDETRASLAELGYTLDEPGTFSNSSRGNTQMIQIDPETGARIGGAAPNGRDFVAGF
ncbi:gamma-glutamyltransferase family protein [Paracoccus sp. S-4012]|uniref:gamma-glutamyltransferase family protein n=1 Tax=Paracoccus sp. S-4012 TaxID=2665648 RepID=UPI00351B3BDD